MNKPSRAVWTFSILALSVLVLIIGLNWLAFRFLAYENYFVWYVKNGARPVHRQVLCGLSAREHAEHRRGRQYQSDNKLHASRAETRLINELRVRA